MYYTLSCDSSVAIVTAVVVTFVLTSVLSFTVVLLVVYCSRKSQQSNQVNSINVSYLSQTYSLQLTSSMQPQAIDKWNFYYYDRTNVSDNTLQDAAVDSYEDITESIRYTKQFLKSINNNSVLATIRHVALTVELPNEELIR